MRRTTTPSNGTGGTGAGDGTGEGGPTPHRVLGFARSLHAALDRAQEVPVWSMTVAEEREALVALDEARTRLAAFELRVLAQADRDEVGADCGATSTPAWLATATRQTRTSCGADLRLATELAEEFTETGAALAAGRVNLDQARVIVAAVTRLSAEHDDLPPGTHRVAEAHLLELAATHDAVFLRQCGRRLFEVVCPEAADAAEAEQLRKDEGRARRVASFSLRDNGDGTHEGHFRLPDLHAALLKKALEALTAPRRLGAGRSDPVTGKKLPYPVLLGQGSWSSWSGWTPNGCRPRVGHRSRWSSPFPWTRCGPGSGRPGWIPAPRSAPARPAGWGVPRGSSRWSSAAAPNPWTWASPNDCSRPRNGSRWPTSTTAARPSTATVPRGKAKAHHKKPWSQGGPTDLANGIPLCPPHHQMADHPETWNMKTMPGGGVRFSRRQ